jgi:hypothetical protein
MPFTEPPVKEIKEVPFSLSSSPLLPLFDHESHPLQVKSYVFHDPTVYSFRLVSFADHKSAEMMITRSLSGKEAKIHNLTRRHLLGLFARLLNDFADSRSNPFQEGEDDVILAALRPEAIQVLDPDADEAELRMVPPTPIEKTALRHLGILAHTGSTKFRLKPVSTCWKAILSGYNIH